MQILIKIGFVLSLASLVFGCMAGNTNYAGGDEISYSEVKEAAERGEVEKVLGEPSKIQEVAGRRIEAYEIYGGTRALYIWPAIFIPTDSKFSYLTIAYQPDGFFLGLETWPGAKTPDEAIRMFDALIQEESDLCFRANRGDSDAQRKLGRRYWIGLRSYEVNRVEAHKWFLIAELGGNKLVEANIELSVAKMTSEELAEAERLASEWSLGEADCRPPPFRPSDQ